MDNSKAQGLSLNTIIIAAIVLVVLFILIGITTGYLGDWRGTFGKISDTSCSGQGGEPKGSCGSDEKEAYAEVDSGTKCCVKKECGEYRGGCQAVGGCRGWENDVGKRGCGEGKTCCRDKTLPS